MTAQHVKYAKRQKIVMDGLVNGGYCLYKNKFSSTSPEVYKAYYTQAANTKSKKFPGPWDCRKCVN